MLDTIVIDLDNPPAVVVDVDVAVKVGQLLRLDVDVAAAVDLDVVDVGALVAGVL